MIVDKDEQDFFFSYLIPTALQFEGMIATYYFYSNYEKEKKMANKKTWPKPLETDLSWRNQHLFSMH